MSAGPADKALDVFKDVVFDQLVKAAITYIVGLAPFLSFGPIAFIISKVVTYVAGLLYLEMKEAINFQVILLNNRSLHDKFVTAQIELRKIALEKGIDSPEFRVNREAHKKALAEFSRYGATK